MHRLVNMTSSALVGRNLLELDVDDVANLSEATFEIFLAGVFGEAADIDLVQLKFHESNSRIPKVGVA